MRDNVNTDAAAAICNGEKKRKEKKKGVEDEDVITRGQEKYERESGGWQKIEVSICHMSAAE